MEAEPKESTTDKSQRVEEVLFQELTTEQCEETLSKLKAYYDEDQTNNKVFEQLINLSKRVNDDKVKTQKLLTQGYPSILFFGSTGVGKSTTANAIVQGPQVIKKKKGEGLICSNTLKQDGEVIFQIGKSNSSVTQSPGIYCHHDLKINLIDCPGLKDTDPFKEYPNVTSIVQCLKASKYSKIVLVQKIDEAMSNRMQGVIEQIAELCSFFNLDAFKNKPENFEKYFEDNFYPIFTKGFENEFDEDILSEAIDDVIARIECKIKVLDGHKDAKAACVALKMDSQAVLNWLSRMKNMPNDSDESKRWELVMTMFKAFKKNYKYVCPRDQNPTLLDEEEPLKRLMKCNQMLEILCSEPKHKITNECVVSSDIPSIIMDSMVLTYYQNLKEHQLFKTSDDVREYSSTIFAQILSPYQGQNVNNIKNLLINIVCDAFTKQYSKLSEWYNQNILKSLKEQAQLECNEYSAFVKIRDKFHLQEYQQQFPITTILAKQAYHIRKLKEHDIFTKDDWDMGLHIMLNNKKLISHLLQNKIEQFPCHVQGHNNSGPITFLKGLELLQSYSSNSKITEPEKKALSRMCSKSLVYLYSVLNPKGSKDSSELILDQVTWLLDPEKKYTKLLIQDYAKEQGGIVGNVLDLYSHCHEGIRKVGKFFSSIFS